jgi:hypothetical protein
MNRVNRDARALSTQAQTISIATPNLRHKGTNEQDACS